MTSKPRQLAIAAMATLALSLLGGCSLKSFVDAPPAPQIYVLRPPLGAVADAPQVHWALDVAVPDAPISLSNVAIAVQRSAETLDFYADSAWSDRLPALIQRTLVQGFEQSGKIEAVAADSQGLNATYLLQTEIRRFEANYPSPDGAPVIEVVIGARLVNIASRSIVATTVVHQSVAASANSVPAAIAAFDQATAKAVAVLVGWTLRAPGSKSGDAGKASPPAAPRS